MRVTSTLTLTLVESIAIHFPVLSRNVSESTPSSWLEVIYTPPICITICGSHFYRDAFAEASGLAHSQRLLGHYKWAKHYHADPSSKVKREMKIVMRQVKAEVNNKVDVQERQLGAVSFAWLLLTYAHRVETLARHSETMRDSWLPSCNTSTTNMLPSDQRHQLADEIKHISISTTKLGFSHAISKRCVVPGGVWNQLIIGGHTILIGSHASLRKARLDTGRPSLSSLRYPLRYL